MSHRAYSHGASWPAKPKGRKRLTLLDRRDRDHDLRGCRHDLRQLLSSLVRLFGDSLIGFGFAIRPGDVTSLFVDVARNFTYRLLRTASLAPTSLGARGGDACDALGGAAHAATSACPDPGAVCNIQCYDAYCSVWRACWVTESGIGVCSPRAAAGRASATRAVGRHSSPDSGACVIDSI
jgi:hypothetical protein